MASTTNATILVDPQHWENWFQELRSGIMIEIWALLDPDEPEKLPLPAPEMPTFAEYHAGANRFSDLNQTERKDFLSAQHIYESQLKAYDKQAQRLLDVRNKIYQSVSNAKKAQLPLEATTREWIRILRDGTRPSEAMARRTAGLRYQTAITPIRSTSAKTVISWIQDWETAMAEGVRASLIQATNREIWLADFCAAIRGIAESFATDYELKLTRGTMAESFQEVGSAFRGWYSVRYPVATQALTIRGGAFQAEFAGERLTPDEEAAEATDQVKTINGSSERGRKRQRSSTSSAGVRKQGKARCIGCNSPRHDLGDCWVAITALRPPSYRPPQEKVDKLEKRLKEDKDFAESVRRARKEHEDQA